VAQRDFAEVFFRRKEFASGKPLAARKKINTVHGILHKEIENLDITAAGGY
jgi:hypothetical protein